ncbi:hypothetical protein [Thermococcus sp. 21S9]|uniref:hypothetical protein n=1 Tax=Thermococcus sp. 21S9 TaxID=1638223 RepID=UPI00143BAF4A|nr:hypothetical protein [Thermococcus sp. 21S9]
MGRAQRPALIRSRGWMLPALWARREHAPLIEPDYLAEAGKPSPCEETSCPLAVGDEE